MTRYFGDVHVMLPDGASAGTPARHDDVEKQVYPFFKKKTLSEDEICRLYFCRSVKEIIKRKKERK